MKRKKSKRFSPKQLSNPFSTGGGGFTFENRVQAAFVALMLSNGACPCLAYCWPIVEVVLQPHYLGYETDDTLVKTRNDNTGASSRLLAQVKHSISFTKKDRQMPAVIGAAWRDFNNKDRFNPDCDAIALITGSISKTDGESVCRLLEFARGSRDAADFEVKIKQLRAVSNAQREKLLVIKTHIAKVNDGLMPDGETLLKFLKCFYLIGFDMDLISGVSISLIQSLIKANSPNNVEDVWNKILQEVQQKNTVSGVLTQDSVSQPLRDCFKKDGIKPIIAIAPHPIKETLALNLIGNWNESSEGDRAIVETLSDIAFTDWQAKVREIWKGQKQ
jgi:hypothetical protein